jgi:hypothetical protein
MTRRFKNAIKEAAFIFNLFCFAVCLLVIGLHFIEQVDTEFQDLARVVEIIKNDPLAFLRGGEGYEPSDFSNFKIIATWLLQF